MTAQQTPAPASPGGGGADGGTATFREEDAGLAAGRVGSPVRPPTCDLTELPVDGCAHCRGHSGPDWGAFETTGRRFTARYDGNCGVCGGEIVGGRTEVQALTDRFGYACEGCLA